MPRSDEIEQQLESLYGLVVEHPQGIRRDALAREYAARYGSVIQWRTLLRRLEHLLEDGRIVATRAGRQRTYQAAPPAGAASPMPAVPGVGSSKHDAVEDDYVPLSAPGAEIRALVRRPITQREHIGYKLEFLKSYRPGRTWYLPEELREQLHEMGRTPEPDRPAGTFARDVFDRLLIDLSWASSRLEGNTYTRLDTLNLLRLGEVAEGSDAQNTQMILNHKRAIEFLVDEAESVRFDRRTLTTLHSALAENLLDDPRDEGGIRKRPVKISGTHYTPMAIPQALEDTLDLLLDMASAIPDPFEQSFFVMVHIPYLQPFADVNKRTSRLAANIPLIRANLCPLSFVDVPERAYVEGILGVYEHTRIELLRDVYLWAYRRSSDQYKVIRESMGQPDPVRLKYRNALNDAVQNTIVSMSPPDARSMRDWARDHGIPTEDLDAFVDLALLLIVSLHEGNAGRYRIRPSQFDAWRDRFNADSR